MCLFWVTTLECYCTPHVCELVKKLGEHRQGIPLHNRMVSIMSRWKAWRVADGLPPTGQEMNLIGLSQRECPLWSKAYQDAYQFLLRKCGSSNWGGINSQWSTVDQGWIYSQQSTVDQGQIDNQHCQSTVNGQLLIRSGSTVNSQLLIRGGLTDQQSTVDQGWIDDQHCQLSHCWLSQECIVGIPWCIMGNPLSSDTQLQVGSVLSFLCEMWDIWTVK